MKRMMQSQDVYTVFACSKYLLFPNIKRQYYMAPCILRVAMPKLYLSCESINVYLIQLEGR